MCYLASLCLEMSSFVVRQAGEIPLSRFGHTCCQVGENYVVLFGGATGDSSGKYTINNDTYILDMRTSVWSKLIPSPQDTVVPSPRAAHCSCKVDHMQMIVYGGATGGGSLSSDELFLLDVADMSRTNFTSSKKIFSWLNVPTTGVTPGKRYGHVMVFSKPSLIVFGGNNGQTALNDIWTIDLGSSDNGGARRNFTWTQVRVIDPSRSPPPRVYHSADICTEGPAAGMVVVFGGRTSDNRSLKDTWGLRQHRDGRWDWVEAPARRGPPPEARYQHCCLFWNTKLFIIGGRGSEASKHLPVSVYDTETCEWRDYMPGIDRFRHSAWLWDKKEVFSYGGFNHVAPSNPTSDLQQVNIAQLMSGGGSQPMTVSSSPVAIPPQPVPAVVSLTMAHLSTPTSAGGGSGTVVGIAQNVYVAMDTDAGPVRQVGIDTLGEEGRKIRSKFSGTVGSTTGGYRSGSNNELIDSILRRLLNHWTPPQMNVDEYGVLVPGKFFLTVDEITSLCYSVLEIIKSQPMVLQVRAPIKVYGDLHGQFPDLLRMFAKYGSPQLEGNGDIETTDYLFLGDFVDRGSFSLETLVLLFALKCRYPDQIHLIRGNHEDSTINALYGFKDECRRRLVGEDPDRQNSAYNIFNTVFEWLPCGAVIDSRVLCIHGGIGGSIESVADIENLSRPLKVSQTPTTVVEQKITDLLWSDPTDSDALSGISMNETRDPDGSGRIVKFGPDRVEKFLTKNVPLQLIIRAHECVMDGFERFANGKLITVFSATDYCGHHKNAGALLFIRRDLTVIPKLIYPSNTTAAAALLEPELWDSRITQLRPPTPPRHTGGTGGGTSYPLNSSVHNRMGNMMIRESHLQEKRQSSPPQSHLQQTIRRIGD